MTKNYKKLKVESLRVAGIKESLKAMRLPKGGTSLSLDEMIYDSDADLARRLIKAGTDHAKCMRGVIVWLKMDMQVGFMIEFETYRHGVECLSTSSAMHGELIDLEGEELAEKKQRDLPDKVYTRILTASYQALRSMYKARRGHRHPDWRIFCAWIETLPFFDILIMPEKAKK